MQEKNRAIRKNSEMKKSKDTEQKEKLNKKDNLNIGREAVSYKNLKMQTNREGMD